MRLKPPSVTKNVVGLLIDDVGHVDRNSSADVARVVGLQTDAVVVTETRFTYKQVSDSKMITQPLQVKLDMFVVFL